MTFRPTFSCLWCGRSWSTRGPDDLEGWARLCSECLGKAGTNPFLRSRLREGLRARAVGGDPAADPSAAAVPLAAARPVATPPGSGPATAARTAALPSAAAAPPALPDDWFLRRGPFERGAIHDTAWAAELDAVTRWLDGRPLTGRIIELAAGTGFFSPLLAERGELYAFDRDEAALALARERLVAHRLRAHLHVADPWAPLPPAADPTPADALVAAFLVGRVRGAGLDPAAVSLRERLRTGAALAMIDLRPDPAGGPPPEVPWTWHDPSAVEAALLRAGFREVEPSVTGRFFLTIGAVAG